MNFTTEALSEFLSGECMNIGCQRVYWYKKSATDPSYCSRHYIIQRNRQCNKLMVEFKIPKENAEERIDASGETFNFICQEVDLICNEMLPETTLSECSQFKCAAEYCNNEIDCDSFVFCSFHRNAQTVLSMVNCYRSKISHYNMINESDFVDYTEIDHFDVIDSNFHSFNDRYDYMMGLVKIKYPFQLEEQPEAWIQRLLLVLNAVPSMVIQFIDSAFGIEMKCAELSRVREYPIFIVDSIALLLQCVQDVVIGNRIQIENGILFTLSIINEMKRLRNPSTPTKSKSFNPYSMKRTKETKKVISPIIKKRPYKQRKAKK